MAVPQESKPGTTVAPAVRAKTAPSVPVGAGDEVKEMNFVRRIAFTDRMVESKRISPHVTTVIEVDVTKLVRWRDKHKDDFKRQEGINLTYITGLCRSCIQGADQFPQINASVDGYNVILKRISMWVSLYHLMMVTYWLSCIHEFRQVEPERSCTSIDSLALKARANKLSADDIQGIALRSPNFGFVQENIFGTLSSTNLKVAHIPYGII